MDTAVDTEVAIVGAGFTGLSAAYELTKKHVPVVVLEEADHVGGLAGAFTVGETQLDRFYHHWFTNDVHVMRLVDELNMNDHVVTSSTNTGMYYANHFFRLSTPLDLLKFKPLGLLDRVRLGLLTLRARRVRHWRELESKTAHEWLIELGGENVYRVVWEPLLKGKFGPYAEDISAVWFWNKLKLRGGSRGKGGEERLAYFDGGFVALAEALRNRIEQASGRVRMRTRADHIERDQNGWIVHTTQGSIRCKQVIATLALPLVADMIGSWADSQYIESLRRIRYIGNVCLVLELEHPLSDIYWLNVNDPSFPFVGVIEHTNFADPTKYGGRHLVYLSKYLPHTDSLYSMNAEEFLDYALPYLQRMFPALQRDSILQYHLWRARWSQPVVTKHYGALIPPFDGPAEGFHLCSMAQIYPEDRGTNYAIREGRKAGLRVADNYESA